MVGSRLFAHSLKRSRNPGRFDENALGKSRPRIAAFVDKLQHINERDRKRGWPEASLALIRKWTIAHAWLYCVAPRVGDAMPGHRPILQASCFMNLSKAISRPARMSDLQLPHPPRRDLPDRKTVARPQPFLEILRHPLVQPHRQAGC